MMASTRRVHRDTDGPTETDHLLGLPVYDNSMLQGAENEGNGALGRNSQSKSSNQRIAGLAGLAAVVLVVAAFSSTTTGSVNLTGDSIDPPLWTMNKLSAGASLLSSAPTSGMNDATREKEEAPQSYHQGAAEAAAAVSIRPDGAAVLEASLSSDNDVRVHVDSIVETWDQWKYQWAAKMQSVNWTGPETKFHDAWSATEEGAQHAAQKAKGLRIRDTLWWNTTVESESEWQHVASKHLRKFGRLIRHWWSSTQGVVEKDAGRAKKRAGKAWNATEQGAGKDTAGLQHAAGRGWNRTERFASKEEEAVQLKFKSWYQAASTEERTWWNQTVQAAHKFGVKASDKEHLWWRMAEDAAAQDWNATKRKSAAGWNWTEAESAVAWNATRSEEEIWLNATKNWFNSHLRDVDQDDDDLRQPLLYLNKSSAYSLLMNGYGWYDYSADFFAYQSGFDVQQNQAYCAVATSAALLNSLRSSAADLTLPIDSIYKPYEYATQSNLLASKCSHRHVIRHNTSFEGIFHTPGGVSLGQTKALLECNLPAEAWVVTAVEVNETVSRDRFRREISGAVRNKHARVLINYNRAVLGQHGSGHFSPIASYSKEQDAFLILDVAKYKYDSVWVSSDRLHAAANTIDTCGSWEYPAGQDRLTPEQLMYNGTRKDYEKGLKVLDCKATYRGYIVVRPRQAKDMTP